MKGYERYVLLGPSSVPPNINKNLNNIANVTQNSITFKRFSMFVLISTEEVKKKQHSPSLGQSWLQIKAHKAKLCGQVIAVLHQEAVAQFLVPGIIRCWTCTFTGLYFYRRKWLCFQNLFPTSSILAKRSFSTTTGCQCS